MKINNKITPKGFRDYLFEESEAQTAVENRLSALFASRGYHSVVTPALEFMDVFTCPEPAIPIEQMYKLTDRNGRLLVLRPDITLPIARLAATRLQNMPRPVRLCYTEKVFKVNPGLNGRRDEVTQSGVELLGAAGKRADLEILKTAADALSVCGATEFKIEIGHAAVFKGLIAELDTDGDTAERVRRLIESKCYAALDDELDKLENQKIAGILRRLPHLFGGGEVLEEAAALCGDICGDALQYLRDIYDTLQTMSLAGRVDLDLGLVHSNTYYTGLLLRGYLFGSGVTVLSGGRYDHLLQQFGEPMPAIGFAVENDAVAELLCRQGAVDGGRIPDVLVFGEPGYEMQAVLYCTERIAQGQIAENSVFDSWAQSLEYAKQRGIPAVVRVGASIAEERI